MDVSGGDISPCERNPERLAEVVNDVPDERHQRVNRVERRKQRTRAALIEAAQGFIAAGKLNVTVLDITQAADVGIGSFYNHFGTKEQLFQAAIDEFIDLHGALLDRLSESEQDPAETFARSFRLTGRLFRRRPQEARVFLNSGVGPISSDRGLAQWALRYIDAANRAGRFHVADPELALAMVAGTLNGLGQLLQDQPARDDAQATDQITESLLRVFGVSANEAHEISHRPLPDHDDLGQPGPAA
jgi:AcrR family transcriptional regulator